MASDVARGRSSTRSGAPPSEPLVAFLDRLAAGSPMPGGGAAAAVTGSMAAALLAMSARVTARGGADPAGLAGLATSADECRHELLALAAGDEDAYGTVVAARRAGLETAYEDALRRAIDVPLAIARAGRRVLHLARALAPGAKAAVASDVAVAVSLARAAVEAAADTARANLGDLADEAYATRARAEVAALVADADALARELGRERR